MGRKYLQEPDMALTCIGTLRGKQGSQKKKEKKGRKREKKTPVRGLEDDLGEAREPLKAFCHRYKETSHCRK